MFKIVEIDSHSCGTVLEYCDGMVTNLRQGFKHFYKKVRSSLGKRCQDYPQNDLIRS